ncbi:MAG: DUF805 domain-containing protein [Pararobbsia sp.]
MRIQIRQLASIKGRTTRQQFILLNLSMLAYSWIGTALNRWIDAACGEDCGALIVTAQALYICVFLVGSFMFIWLSFATTVRRLHDLNLSGWWILLALIPIVNGIFLVVLGCVPPVEPNDYDRASTALYLPNRGGHAR